MVKQANGSDAETRQQQEKERQERGQSDDGEGATTGANR